MNATMCERFTDRARKVMQLANQDAQRFNHEHIGTEHILLGLVKEGTGVAAYVLTKIHDIDLRKIRLELEKIEGAGPDMVITSNLVPTPRAHRVIEFAVQEARELNHNYIGTEHLLLGILRLGMLPSPEGIAFQIILNLGVKLEDVRQNILNLLGHEKKASAQDESESKALAAKSFCLDFSDSHEAQKLRELLKSHLNLPEGKISRIVITIE